MKTASAMVNITQECDFSGTWKARYSCWLTFSYSALSYRITCSRNGLSVGEGTASLTAFDGISMQRPASSGNSKTLIAMLESCTVGNSCSLLFRDNRLKIRQSYDNLTLTYRRSRHFPWRLKHANTRFSAGEVDTTVNGNWIDNEG